MRKQHTLLIAILLAVILVVVLSIKGWQGDSGTVSQDSSEEEVVTNDLDNGHDHEHEHEMSHSSFTNELDQKAMEAAEMVRNAASAADVMQAVTLLRGNLSIDSNHIGSLELMAELSIQSGQLEKAHQRYEKLVSLQPENQGYKERLNELCKQLGRSDC